MFFSGYTSAQIFFHLDPTTTTTHTRSCTRLGWLSPPSVSHPSTRFSCSVWSSIVKWGGQIIFPFNGMLGHFYNKIFYCRTTWRSSWVEQDHSYPDITPTLSICRWVVGRYQFWIYYDIPMYLWSLFLLDYTFAMIYAIKIHTSLPSHSFKHKLVLFMFLALIHPITLFHPPTHTQTT